MGFSWTLDKEKGEWFGSRFFEGGWLIEGMVDKKDIISYFNGRKEQEVIVLPSQVSDIKVINLGESEGSDE